MIKTVIIEDELLAAQNLLGLLADTGRPLVNLAVIDNVAAAVQWLQLNTVDLIFLDIHLGDDLSFRIFEELKIDTPVIFTTAYDEYAIKAFKLNSIDYLLKPVRAIELYTAIERYRQRIQTPADISDLIAEMNRLKPEYKRRFMVTVGQRIKSVPVEDVAYFVSEGRYVTMVAHDNAKYLIDETMEKLEQLLDPTAFFRINRQMIIAFSAIKSMMPFTKGRVQIEIQPDINTDIIVSVDRSPAFKKWLDR